MLRKNKYKVMAILLFTVLAILGLKADKNFIDFEIYDEMSANYEFNTSENTNVQLDYSVNFPYKVNLVDLNGMIRKIVGQREMNGILKLNNGHLISPEARKNDLEIEKSANEIIKFASYCKGQGKPFVYVQPNLKVDEKNKQLPVGTEDYSNENIDVLLKYLRKAGIDVIDIRECMHDEGMNMYDYTYITDHHWNINGCFYTFQKITEWIGKKTGVIADSLVTSPDNYSIEVHPKWHLGTYGQRTGQYFGGIDDYDLLIPKYNVVFKSGTESGKTFYESAVDSDVFKIWNPTSRYTYDTALRVPDGRATTSKKLSILMVSDSYATAMAPYLKLAYSDYTKQSMPSGLKADYVLEAHPDVVIMMPYYTSVFDNSAVFINSTATK